MGISLYHLTGELRQQMATLADVDLPLEAMQDTLESIQAPFEDKVRAVVAYAREIDAEADFVKAEADRMAKRAKALQGRADGLRDYVLAAIQAAGYAKPLRFSEFTVSVAKKPPKVEIQHEELVPADFQTVIPEQRQPDKVRILEALKAGAEIPGCTLLTGGFRLAVR